MYHCSNCGWVGDDPHTITEEEIMSDPDLAGIVFEEILEESVGQITCPDCSWYDLIELD